MDISVTFNFYRKKIQYAAMILFIGTITAMLAAKVSPMLSIATGSYWLFLSLKIMTNKIVQISQSQIIISNFIGRVQINRKVFPMSDFYGVRNRVHWGHYKHCHTELVGKNGVFLPIRIELMTEKTTPEAQELKVDLTEKFKLEACRDLGAT